MDEEEDLLAWVEVRVSRYYWLANMRQKIGDAAENSKKVHEYLTSHLNALALFKRSFVAGSSCPGDCNACCCYFPKEYASQLPLSNSERMLLDRILSGEGVRPADYYTLVPLEKVSSDVQDYLEGMPGFIFKRNGVSMACMLNPSDQAVSPELLKHIPKTVKKYRRMWVKSDSCACRFLSSSNKCRLYDRLRFTICREFYCLPAITVIVLRNLGLADESIMEKPLSRLNALADRIALEYRSREVLKKEKEYDSMVRELALAQLNGEETEGLFKKIKKFEREYDKKLKEDLKTAMEGT